MTARQARPGSRCCSPCRWRSSWWFDFTIVNVALPSIQHGLYVATGRWHPAGRQLRRPELRGPGLYTTFALPSFSPAVHGAGAATELTSSNQPVVNLYRDIQFQPSSAG
jgi:hypothetical protein